MNWDVEGVQHLLHLTEIRLDMSLDNQFDSREDGDRWEILLRILKHLPNDIEHVHLNLDIDTETPRATRMTVAYDWVAWWRALKAYTNLKSVTTVVRPTEIYYIPAFWSEDTMDLLEETVEPFYICECYACCRSLD